MNDFLKKIYLKTINKFCPQYKKTHLIKIIIQNHQTLKNTQSYSNNIINCYVGFLIQKFHAQLIQQFPQKPINLTHVKIEKLFYKTINQNTIQDTIKFANILLQSHEPNFLKSL